MCKGMSRGSGGRVRDRKGLGDGRGGADYYNIGIMAGDYSGHGCVYCFDD